MVLINWKNDNATNKFYLVQAIFKSRAFGRNFAKNRQISKNSEHVEERASALRVIGAGTRLMVHQVDGLPRAAIPNRGELA